MTDSNKPDLEESTNVRTTHRDVDRAAAASSREMQVRENGQEPISSIVIVALVIVALIGGGVLFKGQLFNYGDHPEGYKRSDDPAGGVKGPPLGPAGDVYVKAGAALYSNNCAACHGPQGGGNSGPPLVKSQWVTNTSHFVGIVTNGLKGDIEVNGKTYSGLAPMNAVGASMTDFDIAAINSYLRSTFGNETIAEPIITSPAQVKEIRANLKARPKGEVTMKELLEADHFKKEIKAEPLDKATIVDKKTGEAN